MQTRLIAIGNSYGIRIPKSIIQQLNLDKKNIEISVKDNVWRGGGRKGAKLSEVRKIIYTSDKVL